MGYHIYFSGELTVTPPLQDRDREILEYIFNSDQKKQDVFFEIPMLPANLAEILRQDSYIGSEFAVNNDGTLIEAHGEESSYDANSMETFWKEIAQHVLPSYRLYGQFNWDASGSNDGTGTLWISGKQVEAVSDVTSNPGPSWERES
jgi:hypothetical protein